MGYRQRAYKRGNGSQIVEADIKPHCRENPPGYEIWEKKLVTGKPPFWPYSKEQPTAWTEEERERVHEALGELPDLLKDKNMGGIYRLREATFPGNPSTNNYSDIALYDAAFKSPYILAQILGHEFSHRFYENLSKDKKKSFQNAADWHHDSKGELYTRRPESKFLRKNGMLSVEEDFADALPAFVLTPLEPKRKSPEIYGWIEKNYGRDLQPGGKK